MSHAAAERLSFLLETVALEATHLLQTDARLFAQAFTPDRAAALKLNLDESERTDAFVARFGRLQDTLGDKRLPESCFAGLQSPSERPSTTSIGRKSWDCWPRPTTG
ncbi:hypothetical protein [Roseateles toxinivorans]|uniref:Uncharacterized protein n=1 Tax=Roseateles toxinivorans TaxID=270368 RepID=A0A4R6QM95_9BURK|nr:hypothetical protein [Roseateles toxinivorans]TDP63355.1 hypothetical protein DES47_105360 [Roseateles toxinivorans]